MNLTIRDLTQESLSGIGWLLASEGQGAPKQVEGFSYVEVVGDLQMEGPLSSGLLECYPRKLSLVRMEQHLHTREILIALEGESVICLAPRQKKSSGSLDGVVALRMAPGQSIILEAGSWHCPPFPTSTQTARFQVVFRSGTGQSDLFFYDFSQPFDIELAATERPY